MTGSLRSLVIGRRAITDAAPFRNRLGTIHQGALHVPLEHDHGAVPLPSSRNFRSMADGSPRRGILQGLPDTEKEQPVENERFDLALSGVNPAELIQSSATLPKWLLANLEMAGRNQPLRIVSNRLLTLRWFI